MVYEMKKTVEDLLQSSYWIIDILPSQVPEDSPGQFFSVEEYFLQGDRIEEIKQKHIDLVLKLNCYRDISISDETVVNPLPKHIADEMKKRYLYIMLGESMILSEPDDTHLTVFNPGAFPRYYYAASNKAVFRGILSVFGLGRYSAVIV